MQRYHLVSQNGGVVSTPTYKPPSPPPHLLLFLTLSNSTTLPPSLLFYCTATSSNAQSRIYIAVGCVVGFLIVSVGAFFLVQKLRRPMQVQAAAPSVDLNEHGRVPTGTSATGTAPKSGKWYQKKPSKRALEIAAREQAVQEEIAYWAKLKTRLQSAIRTMFHATNLTSRSLDSLTIARDRLTLHHEIGQGAFGVVRVAQLKPISTTAKTQLSMFFVLQTQSSG